jgi:hypothetical protein
MSNMDSITSSVGYFLRKYNDIKKCLEVILLGLSILAEATAAPWRSSYTVQAVLAG